MHQNKSRLVHVDLQHAITTNTYWLSCQPYNLSGHLNWGCTDPLKSNTFTRPKHQRDNTHYKLGSWIWKKRVCDLHLLPFKSILLISLLIHPWIPLCSSKPQHLNLNLSIFLPGYPLALMCSCPNLLCHTCIIPYHCPTVLTHVLHHSDTHLCQESPLQFSLENKLWDCVMG